MLSLTSRVSRSAQPYGDLNRLPVSSTYPDGSDQGTQNFPRRNNFSLALWTSSVDAGTITEPKGIPNRPNRYAPNRATRSTRSVSDVLIFSYSAGEW